MVSSLSERQIPINDLSAMPHCLQLVMKMCRIGPARRPSRRQAFPAPAAPPVAYSGTTSESPRFPVSLTPIDQNFEGSLTENNLTYPNNQRKYPVVY